MKIKISCRPCENLACCQVLDDIPEFGVNGLEINRILEIECPLNCRDRGNLNRSGNRWEYWRFHQSQLEIEINPK